VIILDCHEGWCGPTTQAMAPSYTQMFAEFTEAITRIQIATVVYSPEVIEILAKISPDTNFEEQGCRPLFLLIRNGACAGVVDGLNTPNLISAVRLWIPAFKKEEEQ